MSFEDIWHTIRRPFVALKWGIASNAPAMDPDQFWGLIQKVRAGGATDGEEVAAAVQEELLGESAKNIVGFQKRLKQLMAQAYSGRLWLAGILAQDGMSDDSFDYFLAWLVSQGKDAYESVLKDPDNLADVIPQGPAGEELDAESLMYAALEAAEEQVGGELPGDMWEADDESAEPDFPFEPEDSDAMRAAFPRMWARYRTA